jgi:hypothetical protein
MAISFLMALLVRDKDAPLFTQPLGMLFTQPLGKHKDAPIPNPKS